MQEIQNEQNRPLPDDIAGVHICFDRLSILQRNALLFYLFDGMTYDEIASALECPIGTVAPLIHDAKDALTQEIERFCNERLQNINHQAAR